VAESVARQRINWSVLGVEAAAIFFSVLLGFAATEWREARQEALTIEQAMIAYEAEIAENQRRVAMGYRYHRALNDTIPRLSIPEGASLFSFLARAGWTGPRQVVFRNAGRATAEATGVLGMIPFEDAAYLVGLYDYQDALDETERGLSNAAFNPAISDDANLLASIRAISTYFAMVVEQEQNLLHSYKATIEALDFDVVPAADTLLADS
jgi:hypothetical protein